MVTRRVTNAGSEPANIVSTTEMGVRLDMNAMELETLFSQLLPHGESETIEFKRGGSHYETHEIGKYFSALSNEANLRNTDNYRVYHL